MSSLADRVKAAVRAKIATLDPLTAQDDVVYFVYGPKWIEVDKKAHGYAPEVRVFYNGEIIADDFPTYWSAVEYMRDVFGANGYTCVDLRSLA